MQRHSIILSCPIGHRLYSRTSGLSTEAKLNNEAHKIECVLQTGPFECHGWQLASDIDTLKETRCNRDIVLIQAFACAVIRHFHLESSHMQACAGLSWSHCIFASSRMGRTTVRWDTFCWVIQKSLSAEGFRPLQLMYLQNQDTLSSFSSRTSCHTEILVFLKQ